MSKAQFAVRGVALFAVGLLVFAVPRAQASFVELIAITTTGPCIHCENLPSGNAAQFFLLFPPAPIFGFSAGHGSAISDVTLVGTFGCEQVGIGTMPARIRESRFFSDFGNWSSSGCATDAGDPQDSRGDPGVMREPRAALLLGTGLLLIGFAFRRRRQVQRQ